MARTIKEIQDQIITGLPAGLSNSNVAEWRLWTYVVAVAIYSFEVVLDTFKRDVELLTQKITPGTKRWYGELCRRFQNGDTLLFDDKTALLYYPKINIDKQIIKQVAISEAEGKLFIKVAKIDDKGDVIPLAATELHNFKSYIEAVKFVGAAAEIISTTADKIRYNLTIYHDPAYASTTVEDSVKQALQNFKIALSFDGRIYTQQLIEAVMACDGVVTAKLQSLDHKGASMDDYVAVDIYADLESGYFDFDKDNCTITTTPA